MATINPREISAYVMIDILDGGGYNNIVLRKTLKKNNSMDLVSKAFVTEMVNGCLRNLIYVDYVINAFSKTQTTKMKPLILSVLRISVYQILFMDRVPDSAACNEGVKIIKDKGFKNLAPFVNAVLRNIARNRDNIALPDKEKQPVLYLSVKYSYPKWIIEYWLETMSFAVVEDMCLINGEAPKVSVCVNTLKVDCESLGQALEKDGVVYEESKYVKNCLYLSKTSDISKLETFERGMFHVMDESSMLAVETLNPLAGSMVIDVCAAPGGKTGYAAEIMKNKGSVLAYDIHEHKIALIDEMATRLGLDIIRASVKNALEFDSENEGIADYLIIDAPCSGLGLVRKKPDIKYTKTAEEIESLVKLQRGILDSSCRYLKQGGTLVYSTCTVSQKENMDNIQWFTDNYPFELKAIDNISLEAILPKGQDTREKGYVQLLPNNKWSGDGFFIAKLTRLPN